MSLDVADGFSSRQVDQLGLPRPEPVDPTDHVQFKDHASPSGFSHQRRHQIRGWTWLRSVRYDAPRETFQVSKHPLQCLRYLPEIRLVARFCGSIDAFKGGDPDSQASSGVVEMSCQHRV